MTIRAGTDVHLIEPSTEKKSSRSKLLTDMSCKETMHCTTDHNCTILLLLIVKFVILHTYIIQSQGSSIISRSLAHALSRVIIVSHGPSHCKRVGVGALQSSTCTAWLQATYAWIMHVMCTHILVQCVQIKQQYLIMIALYTQKEAAALTCELHSLATTWTSACLNHYYSI